VGVRWWGVDDAWKTGVLCAGCADEIAPRGPRSEDFACATRGAARRIDVESELLGDDLDCLLDD